MKLSEEMTLAALNAEWKEISITENMEQVKVMVLVKRMIEPETSLTSISNNSPLTTTTKQQRYEIK
jgi:hypothetical protein